MIDGDSKKIADKELVCRFVNSMNDQKQQLGGSGGRSVGVERVVVVVVLLLSAN